MKNYWSILGTLLYCVGKIVYLVVWVLLIPILYPVIAGFWDGYRAKTPRVMRYIKGAIASSSLIQNIMMMLSLSFIWGYPVYLLCYIFGYGYRMVKNSTV